LIALLCIVAPFRALRGALVLAGAWVALQVPALAGAAMEASARCAGSARCSMGPSRRVIFLLAVGNLAAPSQRLRFIVSALVGALGGLALAPSLDAAWQFAGNHAFISALCFHSGAALAVLAGAALAWTLLRQVFDRVLGGPLDVIVDLGRCRPSRLALDDRSQPRARARAGARAALRCHRNRGVAASGPARRCGGLSSAENVVHRSEDSIAP